MWQRSVSGDERAIRDAVNGWAGSVNTDGTSRNAPASEIKGNAAQVELAKKGVELVLTEFPNRKVSIQASGHSNDQGGSMTFTYQMTDVIQNQQGNQTSGPSAQIERAPSPPDANRKAVEATKAPATGRDPKGLI